MLEKPPEEAASPQRHWRQSLVAAGRTFAVILGGAGIGLLGGLSYGAWVASRTPTGDEFFAAISWIISLVLFGAIGTVAGLAVGLLIMVLTWIVRLAKHLTRGLNR